ncbi:MAG: site-specific integrase [Peptostreptococcus porci]|nr:site-specific integrase [Peptostreptococcus porci]
MNYVEPIRDTNVLEDILTYLKKDSMRNYIMFTIGIYTGLRISDILKLQVKHVRNLKEIRLREQKTNKLKVITINKILKEELKVYISNKEDYEYLIASNRKGNKPISRQRAYVIVKNVCNKFGVENIGTHTMRKTFGYHYYKMTKDTALLQNIFNHADASTTLRYIGINQDSISDAYKSMKYF